MSAGFWRSKRVLVTGHTGFKGSWLSLWLDMLGAQVSGFALDPPTDPSLFTEAQIQHRLQHHILGDVRNAAAVHEAVATIRPDIVFHMAAQALVRQSYLQPVETYAVNVMGTAHVLEAIRQVGATSAFVNVTSDKCYQNNEWAWGYRENEPLGGHDPYSSSKACSELVTDAYRSAFHANGGPWIASGRAGNVIGGGDWALDRILPDTFRALFENETLNVRHPAAIRPWQHVLEPLSGYLMLAERLYTDGAPFASGWNFGPRDGDARPVGWILENISKLCPELRWQVDDAPTVHEANFLKLDSSKARALLGWRARWPLRTALEKTAEWYNRWHGGEDVADATLAQIAAYESATLDD